LGDLGDGVGDGLVQVHFRPPRAEFPCALITQGCRHDRGDQISSPLRLDYVGFGGTLDNRGSLRLSGSKRVRDHMEGDGHPEVVTAELQAPNGTAAEFERGAPVANESCDPGRPDEVAGLLVAERRAELEALAQVGAGLAGVGIGDGQYSGPSDANVAMITNPLGRSAERSVLR